MIRTIAAIALAAPLLVVPAVAQERLEEDISSPVPEAKEDCEALADSLRDQRDDGVLNAQDQRELRSKGC